MDWKALGEKIAQIGLPLLGAALPIPGGAAIGAALAGDATLIGRSRFLREQVKCSSES